MQTSMTGAKQGFTLMEVLVVVAIFSVVTVALVNVFLLSNRSQQKTQAAEVLHATALHIMNRVSTDLRRTGLDYTPYVAQSANLNQAVSVLFLQDGRTYGPAGGGCADAASTPCLQVGQTDPVSGDVTTENMTPKGIQLEQFSVWITPTSDPYTPKAGTGEYGADTPATVTVLLRLRGTGAGASSIRLQQTITMRRYVR